jgi:hypothetical protein
MDRETAVIRAEMSQTRAELDRKIAQLEARARELTPRELSRRYVPEYFVDQVIGGVLVLVGIQLAWTMRRRRARRREVLRAAIGGYAHW